MPGSSLVFSATFEVSKVSDKGKKPLTLLYGILLAYLKGAEPLVPLNTPITSGQFRN
jgi:hypothetical protein